MAGLQLKGLRKSFGAVEVIKGVDLAIEHGEFVVFVGPSGCGKSTLLRMIAGLEDITDGELWIGDTLCNDVEPRDRGIAMVFQSYALYPHMTVYDNFAFSLRLARASREERDQKVLKAARILQMENLLDRKPSQLSGGQRQRVAIGRAIVRDPEVFLFDEPLSNLDAALRVDMRMELSKLHKQLGATMVYVTHDQVEAMTLANRIVVLSGGEVQQVGRPIDLYQHPTNLFVAGFIGSPKMNFMSVRIRAADARSITIGSEDLADVALAIPGGSRTAGEELTLGVRPHALFPDERGAISGSVDLVERLGNETVVCFRLGSGPRWLAVLGGDVVLEPNQDVRFGARADEIMLFDASGSNIAPMQ